MKRFLNTFIVVLAALTLSTGVAAQTHGLSKPKPTKPVQQKPAPVKPEPKKSHHVQHTVVEREVEPEVFVVDGMAYTIDQQDAKATLVTCRQLSVADLKIPKTANVGGRDYAVAEIGDRAFKDCKMLASVVIPGTVTRIGDEAFSGCENLTSATIPASITALGKHVFNACTSLQTINCFNTDPNSIEMAGNTSDVFFSGNSPATCVMYVPMKSLQNYESLLSGAVASISRYDCGHEEYIESLRVELAKSNNQLAQLEDQLGQCLKSLKDCKQLHDKCQHDYEKNKLQMEYAKTIDDFNHVSSKLSKNVEALEAAGDEIDCGHWAEVDKLLQAVYNAKIRICDVKGELAICKIKLTYCAYNSNPNDNCGLQEVISKLRQNILKAINDQKRELEKLMDCKKKLARRAVYVN